jgi:hypothetical protein
MEYPINFVLQVDTEDEYNTMQRLRAALSTEEVLDIKLIEASSKLLNNGHYKQVSGQSCRLFINAVQVAAGNREEMETRFNTECGLHRNSNVILREWSDGTYAVVRSRIVQKLMSPAN